MSKNNLVLNKYNINHRSACRLFRVNSYISNYINRTKGMSFSDYINSLRVEHAKTLLSQNAGNTKIVTITMLSDFSNEQSFYRNFHKFTGKNPLEWMKGWPIGAGTTIRHRVETDLVKSSSPPWTGRMRITNHCNANFYQLRLQVVFFLLTFAGYLHIFRILQDTKQTYFNHE